VAYPERPDDADRPKGPPSRGGPAGDLNQESPTSMRIHTLLRATGVALATGAMLAACAGGEGGQPASDAEKAAWLVAVTRAADLTAQARTARTAIELKEGSEGTTAAGEGVYDARAGRVQLSVVDDAGVKGGIIFDRSTVYVEIPPDQRAAVPDRKQWLKVDVSTLTGATDPGIQSLAQTGNVDPTQGLALLKGMTKDIRLVGSEKVRGAATTHYRGHVDVRTLLTSSPSKVDPQVQQALRQVETSSFPADVWVDGAGRLRKLRYEVTVRGGNGKGKAERACTIEFFDFDTKAKVQLPPADQVFDFSELLAKIAKAKAGDPPS